MSEVDVLRQRLRQKDAELNERESTITRLENENHDALRKSKASESNLQSAKNTIEELEHRVERLKESERAAVARAGDYEKRCVELQRRLEYIQHNASKQSATPQSQSMASPQSMRGTAQTPMRTPGGGQTPSEKASTDLWKASAVIVLQSYKVRGEIQEECSTAFGEIIRSHQQVLTRNNKVMSENVSKLTKANLQSSKMVEADGEKRLEQFRDLADLREQLLLLEREKAILSREVSTQDKAVVELEQQVRHIHQEKLTLETERDDLKVKLAQLSKACVKDYSSVSHPQHDQDVSRGSIVSHSELRAEVARLTADMQKAHVEKDDAESKLRKARGQFSAAEERMKLLYSDGIQAREALLQELQFQRSTTEDRKKELEVEQQRQELVYKMKKMNRRVQELENLVQHKDAALFAVNQQVSRYHSEKKYLDASINVKDPYARGMRSPYTATRSSPSPRSAFK